MAQNSISQFRNLAVTGRTFSSHFLLVPHNSFCFILFCSNVTTTKFRGPHPGTDYDECTELTSERPRRVTSTAASDVNGTLWSLLAIPGSNFVRSPTTRLLSALKQPCQTITASAAIAIKETRGGNDRGRKKATGATSSVIREASKQAKTTFRVIS